METLNTIIVEIEHVLHAIDEKQIDVFVDGLLASPRIFVTGEGRSGFMAKAFAMRLMQLGLTVYVIGETITPTLTRADTLVAVSGSGLTESTVYAAQQARNKGNTILAVTTNPASTLAKLASHTLIIPAATKWRHEGEARTQQPLGSLFDQCCHITLDAICLCIAQRRHINNNLAPQRHSHSQ